MATPRLQVEGAPQQHRDARSWAADIMSVMRIPTFQIVVLQARLQTLSPKPCSRPAATLWSTAASHARLNRMATGTVPGHWEP